MSLITVTMEDDTRGILSASDTYLQQIQLKIKKLKSQSWVRELVKHFCELETEEKFRVMIRERG